MGTEILDESLDEQEVDLETELDLLPVNKRLGNGLTKRSRLLVEAMVHFGLNIREAAEKVGMGDRGARAALRRPGVMQFYQSELRLLRESEKPRSILKMAALRDQKKSLKVSLDASRELAREPAAAQAGNRSMFIGQLNISPGYVCDVSQHASKVQEILRQAGSVRQVDVQKTLETK